jgi:hypothetical protein
MTDKAAAIVVILMDALAHRRDCRRAEPGELLETLFAACLGELEAEGRDMSGWYEWLATKGVEMRPRAPGRYVRRANNQVSAEIEGMIRNLLARGWKKTAIASALRVNRRVVIRVAREAAPSGHHPCSECTNRPGRQPDDKMALDLVAPNR